MAMEAIYTGRPQEQGELKEIGVFYLDKSSQTSYNQVMSSKKKSPPEKTWQLQEAKAKFSEVVDKALNQGPQRVTRHGKDSVIVISEQEYWGVSERPPLYEALRNSAFTKYAQDLDFSRPKDLPRNVDF